MEIYFRADLSEQRKLKFFTDYGYNDPGRFDICQGCPLKMALLSLKSKDSRKAA